MEYIEKSIQEECEGCVFCIDHDLSCNRENLVLRHGEKAFIIMNKYPYINGHLLVVPYRHLSDFEELTDEESLEMQRLIGMCVKVLKDSMRAMGFNIGLNLGRVAGAGIDEHLHYHIIPRWSGDHNFMAVFGETRVISEALERTYNKLKAEFDKQ